MSEIVITIRQSDTKAIEFLNKLKARKAEIKAQTQNKTYSSIFKSNCMKAVFNYAGTVVESITELTEKQFEKLTYNTIVTLIPTGGEPGLFRINHRLIDEKHVIFQVTPVASQLTIKVQ